MAYVSAWKDHMWDYHEEQRGPKELADLLGWSPQSARTIHADMKEVEQAWQKASMYKGQLVSNTKL